MSEPLRVLLVDDNPADLHLAELAFEEHRAVAQVVTRDSGPAALTYLRDPATPSPTAHREAETAKAHRG